LPYGYQGNSGRVEPTAAFHECTNRQSHGEKLEDRFKLGNLKVGALEHLQLSASG
jgi:hypothetical protein